VKAQWPEYSREEHELKEEMEELRGQVTAKVETVAGSPTNMVVAALEAAMAAVAAKAVMEAVAEASEAREADTPGGSRRSRCSRCRESSTRTATQGRRRRRCGC
jgi:cell division septum initiation protein DivIVA